MNTQARHFGWLIAFVLFTVNLNAQIDLELNLNQAIESPAQWSNYSVVATIVNNSSSNATGVVVDFPIADGIVYVGADPFSLSQGTFAIYNDESWSVGNLDAGASATLTINYFNKLEVAPVSYAQVKSANETDSDSTPGNGTPPTPNEDDEASTNGSNSTQELELTCNEDIIVETHDSNSNVICANTTHVFLPSATTDELNCGAAVVEFVDYNVVEGTVYVQVALGGYCNAILVGGFGIVDLNFIATDGCGNSKTCTQRVERKEIYVDINFVDCKNYTVQAAPGATGAIVNYDIPSIEYTGCSNGGPIVALVTGLPSGSEFPIGVSTVVYEATECNNANDFCEFQITVEPANTGGDEIDLELSMAQSVPAPAQWSTYSVDLNLKNNGSSTATGVEVSFPKPDGIVYVGGNQFSLTAGDFEVYGNQVWTVPSLSPGEEVSLQVNYFSLQANAAVAYAQVIAANESDVDSTPGNGTPPTPNEDDEASSENGVTPILKSDLNPSNLQFPSMVVKGETTNFTFDLNNLGTAIAQGDYDIDVFVSETPDPQAGAISLEQLHFSNTPIGTIANVTGDVNIDQGHLFQGGVLFNIDYQPGDYYLFLVVDKEGNVDESNESNNIVSTPFTLVSGASGDCSTSIGQGEFICAKTNSDGSNSLILRNGSNDREVDINANGTLGASNNMPIAGGEDVVSIQGDNVVKVEDGTGNIIYTKPIPQTLLNNYERFDHAIEFNNGFILLAYKNLDPATSTYDAIWAIRTDSDLNPSSEKEILDGGLTYAISAYSGMQVNDSQVAFVVARGIAPSMSRHLVVVQDDLTVLSNSQYGSDNVQSLTFDPTICGSYTLTLLESAGLCTHGSCLTKSTYIGNFVNGLFVAERTRIFRSFTSMGSGTETTTLSLKTQDGGMISTFYEQSVPLSSNPRANIIVTKSLNGVDQAEYIVETEADGIAVMELGGAPYLLVDNNGVLELLDLNCIGAAVTPVDYCEVQSDFPWHEWLSQVNINHEVIWPSGKSVYSDFTTAAPVATLERGANQNYEFDITYSYLTYDTYIHYYVDFNQNGIFEASEGGALSQSAITPGTEVSVRTAATQAIPATAKLGPTRARFIISRNPIISSCDNIAYGEVEDYTVEIVDELPNNREVLLDSPFEVFPNPVIDQLTVDISEIKGVENISIYNSFGHLMISKDLDPSAWDDKVLINTTDLMDGTYVVHLRGDGFKPRAKMIIVQRLY